jgi:hypothetical protein
MQNSGETSASRLTSRSAVISGFAIPSDSALEV